MSHPIHRRFNFSATVTVVPEPAKKSATKSFGLEDASITLSSSCSEFSVGYPVLKEYPGISVQFVSTSACSLSDTQYSALGSSFLHLGHFAHCPSLCT